MIECNLKQLADYLTGAGLMDERLCNMSKAEINDFCEQVHMATEVIPGYTPPFIDENDHLVIPHNVPEKYRWWAGGQSVTKTLEEIGAPPEIIERYRSKL